MARQQMLTIVTPEAPVQVRRDTLRRLDDVLRATGCVHFATLALLPAPPSSAATGAPSLLLEIVLDDGIDPVAAVDMVLAEGFLPLWQIYRHAWPGTPEAGLHARRSWLREYMLVHAQRAACGFIGARDRTVAQILAENRLMEDARRLLPQLRSPAAGAPPNSDQLADQVLQWASNTHAGLLQSPARRSIWRRGGLPPWLRWPVLAVRLVVPALAVMALLGWLGLAVAWLGHALTYLPEALPYAGWMSRRGMHTFAIPGLAAGVMVVMLMLPAMLTRLVEALPAMLLFAAITGVSMLALAGTMMWQVNWGLFWLGLQLVVAGTGAAASLAAAAAGLLALASLPFIRAPPHLPWILVLGVVLLLAGITYMAAAFTQGQFMVLAINDMAWSPLPPNDMAWSPLPPFSVAQQLGWIVVGSLPVALLLVAVPRLWRATQRVGKRIFETKGLPPYVPPAPLHQVHDSVDECEAVLTGRQSHMISLTELRLPTAWHGAWLCVKLWLVNQLADVYFADGRLGSADGIKFGHWRLIDGGRRMLFCSNYDGSFGGYLDEFIRGAWQGVNLIWGATELRCRPPARPDQPSVESDRAFPPISWFILGGCKYEQAFKAYARASMVPHLHRFEAYNLSVQDIERATRLRDALSRPRHPRKSDQILRAIES